MKREVGEKHREMDRDPDPAVVTFRQKKPSQNKKDFFASGNSQNSLSLPPRSNDDRIFTEWVKGRLAGLLA